MSEFKRLSVIMPLYNAGDDFVACMNSLVAQTYPELEIIIVNDGSTDKSPEIAARYAEKYAHIQLLHQSSAGASVARNRGLEAATGEYVAFVDADDIVYPDMYTVLMKMAQEDDLDVAQCNSDWCIRSNGHTWPSIPVERQGSTGVMRGPDWLRAALATRRWTHVVWMGVYRRTLLNQTGIRFIPGLHHQDIIWSTEFMFNARRVRYTQQPLYKYFIHEQSVSRQRRSGDRNVAYQRHYIRITQLLEKMNRDYADRIPIYPEFRDQITREALRVCHAVRKEPNEETRQKIIHEIFNSGTHRLMLRNTRSLKLWYQVLLWLTRLYCWRNRKTGVRRLLSLK
ncbi:MULTISPECIES: glycosyltransferase [Tenebrionibacter/Tenebrionicola group]|jgi:heptose III glucuronosyltransferase|uniref:Glycosyltransferase n=2 Tax=Tenebrionibacter/Tenebrionicola group TaxID=2969848 RepID=A0A8K0V0B2_9ENTR|nr:MULTISPECIES: glycosyltransferase [Tenebrionibacter/Tenebrionicola group]MBK4714367.1 glycosyltransferase [Tenebrionibacter intestinalis]MBV4414265.1 glycosyltransferase [Tenebrionicola larvae]MBV5095226.1 glycosyltransferase [Tenebrionicola larvae]